jgi:DNA-binding NtrC family response regulator/tetratricopeptide (TPR) repeat protein
MSGKILAHSQSLEDAVASGRAAMEESRFEEAANHFRSALRMAPRPGDEEARIRCDLSEALEKRGLHREQLEAVAKYEKLAEFTRLSEQLQMIVLVRLGWGMSFNNNVPRAIAMFNQAMRIARDTQDDAAIGACYFGLARAYRNLLEIRIARDHYNSALEHYRRIGNWRKLAESHLAIGYITAYDGDFRGALQSLKQTLAILGNREEHDLLGRCHMYLAIAYDNLGSTKKALASWEKCLAHFDRAGNRIHFAINQNNLAVKLIWLGDWPRAEELAKQAMETLKDSPSIAQHASAVDTLARLYVCQGKLDEADKLLEQSLQLVNSIKNGEWVEISTQMTIGSSCLLRGQPENAKRSLGRAVDLCLRGSDLLSAAEAQLLLADALLQTGEIEQARQLIESVRTYLRDSPNMLSWGTMMRMLAKLQAADGHTASAIQSLGQSTSIYEIRGNRYACAVNRVLRADLLQRQGRVDQAIAEVTDALQVFEELGAEIDERATRSRLEALKAEASLTPTAEAVTDSGSQTIRRSFDLAASLASGLDGFIAQRLVQAAVSRDLLLHELAVIVSELGSSRGALVAEIIGEDSPAQLTLNLKLAASFGLTDQEETQALKDLAALPPETYSSRFVYRFSDNQQSSFLLQIVEPLAHRFQSGDASIQPILYVVELGLESNLLKSRGRRTQVFDPNRLLAQVELPGFICASRAMSHVLEQIHKIRSSDVTVLITGESGTGKELIARAIHAGSSRRMNTFLPFNCSAAPHEMIESQLFGFRKGAFTGAVANNEGIIRAAEKGTLFLDEIGDLPLKLQPKLLRFLQEGEIHPIGESQPSRVNVRVLAATNSDLERSVAEGRFREDLFHRLNVIRIQVPSLRQRREEIPALINYYLNQYQQDSAKTDIKLSEETVDLLVVYDWPGNVRQLCNEVRRIVAYTDSGAIVTPDSLSAEIVRASREIDNVLGSTEDLDGRPLSSPAETTIAEAVESLERRMIQEALRRSGGNIARAAKELGLSRKGLYLKMDRLNFNPTR